jgi:hypothetical protein
VHPDGYFALVLTPESADLLRLRFATLPCVLAHHCTVRYGSCDPADLPVTFNPGDLGRTFTLKVTGQARRADGGVEAVVVALALADGRVLDQGFTENAIPHVTVATDGVTEPVEANALLRKEFEPVDGPLLLATLVHTRASNSEGDGL